jgi:hypothetical protein
LLLIGPKKEQRAGQFLHHLTKYPKIALSVFHAIAVQVLVFWLLLLCNDDLQEEMV